VGARGNKMFDKCNDIGSLKEWLKRYFCIELQQDELEFVWSIYGNSAPKELVLPEHFDKNTVPLVVSMVYLFHFDCDVSFFCLTRYYVINQIKKRLLLTNCATIGNKRVSVQKPNRTNNIRFILNYASGLGIEHTPLVIVNGMFGCDERWLDEMKLVACSKGGLAPLVLMMT
jgi:hypothetical protein